MISTVTSVSVSTMTSVSTMMGLEVTLGVVAVIALIGFLCARELTTVSEGTLQRFLAKSLDVAIVPLIIAFVMIVATTVVEIIA